LDFPHVRFLFKFHFPHFRPYFSRTFQYRARTRGDERSPTLLERGAEGRAHAPWPQGEASKDAVEEVESFRGGLVFLRLWPSAQPAHVRLDLPPSPSRGPVPIPSHTPPTPVRMHVHAAVYLGVGQDWRVGASQTDRARAFSFLRSFVPSSNALSLSLSLSPRCHLSTFNSRAPRY
jgi:hypothetical protein